MLCWELDGILQAKRANNPSHHSLFPHWLIHLGIPGLFAVAVIDSSPIPLPLPGSTDLLLLLLILNGANIFLVTAAAIAGSAVGGYSCWVTGSKGGEALLQRYMPARFRARLVTWAKMHSTLSIFLSCILPPPIPLTPFLVAAGVLGVSRNRFLIVLTTARTLRYGAVAWAAKTYGRVVVRQWTSNLAGWSGPIEWTFVVLLTGSIVFGIWQYRRNVRQEAQASVA